MSSQDVINAGEGMEPQEPSLAMRRMKSLSTLFLAMAIFALIILLLVRIGQATPPGENSAEAGFARDMIVHHTQAIDMALDLYGHTADTELNSIALDIILTQQNQIGQMQGWLYMWDLPIGNTGPAMTWMGEPTTGLMPGMATPEQMAQLASATGTDADKLFLQLMIAHHQGGIHMAAAILDMTSIQPIKDLATSIVNSQQAEVTLMNKLLDQLSATSGS